MRTVAAIFLVLLVAGCATTEQLQLPPKLQATCNQSGGCVLITRAKFEQMLVQAVLDGAQAAAEELQGQCKREGV